MSICPIKYIVDNIIINKKFYLNFKAQFILQFNAFIYFMNIVFIEYNINYLLYILLP